MVNKAASDRDDIQQSFKINSITIVSIICIAVSIPLLIISEVYNLRTLCFIIETIVMSIYPPIFIYYLGASSRKSKKIFNTIRFILILLYLLFITPTLLKRYSDIPAAITHNYLYSEGKAQIVSTGTKGYIKFMLNNSYYSISTHNFDDILRKDYNLFIQIKIDYLPNSKYIINIE